MRKRTNKGLSAHCIPGAAGTKCPNLGLRGRTVMSPLGLRSRPCSPLPPAVALAAAQPCSNQSVRASLRAEGLRAQRNSHSPSSREKAESPPTASSPLSLAAPNHRVLPLKTATAGSCEAVGLGAGLAVRGSQPSFHRCPRQHSGPGDPSGLHH